MTTYRIGNHVYYWVWLRPDRLIWRVQQQQVIASCSSSTSSWTTASCTVSGLCGRFSSSWSSAVRVSVFVLHLSLLFDDVLFCLPFCWCPCMAINVSVQYDGGFLPDIVLLTQCYYHRGTRLNAMKRFCIFSYWSHLNVLTFFSPWLGDAQKV